MPHPQRRQETDGADGDTHPNIYCVERTLYFFDEVNQNTVSAAIRRIDVLERQNRKARIEIILNSPGGLCYDGYALYDRIRACQCPVVMIGTGIVASMGYVIYLAADIRYVMPNCILMQHQVSSTVDGKYGDIKIEAREIERIEKQLVRIISERTKQNPKLIEKQLARGNDYITPERAVKDGIAQKIIK